MGALDDIHIKEKNGKFYYEIGSATISMCDKVVELLKKYYGTPLYDDYLNGLMNNVLYVNDANNKILTVDNKCQKVFTSTIIKNDSIVKILYKNKHYNRSYTTEIEEFLSGLIFSCPVITEDNLISCYNLTFVKKIIELLESFWKKDINNLSSVLPGVKNNIEVQEKLYNKFSEVFNIKAEAVNCFLNNGTDLQMIISLFCADYISPKTFNIYHY